MGIRMKDAMGKRATIAPINANVKIMKALLQCSRPTPLVISRARLVSTSYLNTPRVLLRRCLAACLRPPCESKKEGRLAELGLGRFRPAYSGRPLNEEAGPETRSCGGTREGGAK